MLTRAEVEELLPLYAGDDLEPELRQRVEAALEADPALRAALAPWAALEGLLQGALTATPAAPATPEPARSAGARVHCPVCRDALFRAAEGAPGGGLVAAVVCASCATPHHAGCFAAHGQCAVLGCGSTRALGEAGAIPLRPCAACARETAAEAPFCAWCGTPREAVVPATRPALAGSSKPADEPARPRVLRGGGGRSGLLAAAGLLLACGLSLGALLGLQQRTFLQALARESARVQVRQAELELPALLSELQAAQRAYRDEDLDGDGARTFAPDVNALLAGLQRAGRGEVYPHLTRGAWRPWFALVWGPARDAESGALTGSTAHAYQGRVVPRFDGQELGLRRAASPSSTRLAFDEARVWEESAQEVSGAIGALLGTWRETLSGIAGVRGVAQRPFELELRTGGEQDPAALLGTVPRPLRAALAAQGLGLRVTGPAREVAYYGDELLQGGER